MLSRVADALYWMARYSERTEANAHIIGVQLVKLLEESGNVKQVNEDWEKIIGICSNSNDYIKNYEEFRTSNIVEFLTSAKSNPNSLVQTSFNVRENARMTRDIIPTDLWEVLNDFYLYVRAETNDSRLNLQNIHKFLDKIKITSMITSGVIHSSMTRDISYHFLKIGKWLERAEKTAYILYVFIQNAKEKDVYSFSEYDGNLALQYVYGTNDFAKKYRFQGKECILHFLLTDGAFPRSIYYCMEHVRKTLMEIENETVSHYSEKMFHSLDDITKTLTYVDIRELSFAEMDEFITDILNKCIEFGNIFSRTYYLAEAPYSN